MKNKSNKLETSTFEHQFESERGEDILIQINQYRSSIILVERILTLIPQKIELRNETRCQKLK